MTSAIAEPVARTLVTPRVSSRANPAPAATMSEASRLGVSFRVAAPVACTRGAARAALRLSVRPVAAARALPCPDRCHALAEVHVAAAAATLLSTRTHVHEREVTVVGRARAAFRTATRAAAGHVHEREVAVVARAARATTAFPSARTVAGEAAASAAVERAHRGAAVGEAAALSAGELRLATDPAEKRLLAAALRLLEDRLARASEHEAPLRVEVLERRRRVRPPPPPARRSLAMRSPKFALPPRFLPPVRRLRVAISGPCPFYAPSW